MPPGFYPIPFDTRLLLPDYPDGAGLLLFPEELDAAMAPEFERTTVFTVGEYSPGWYGDATAYFEASWASRETTTNTSGQGVIELPGDYPLGSFGGLSATMFFNDNFIAIAEVSQTRLTAGIKGDLPFMDGVGSFAGWTYDAYVNYSRSTGQDRIQGISYYPRLEQTLSNTRLDEDSGEIVCDARQIPGEGQRTECRPLDFFEPSFILTGRFSDPDDNAYLFPNRMTNTVVEQTTFQAFATGELFDIPWGGPASLVLGVEYRDDKIRTDTSLTGEFHGFSSDPGSNGTRWLREVFTELDLPLVGDRRFVNELSLNVAARMTREEFFGEETTYRFQAQYGPVDWLRFRATVGTSFRAPNLGEQFGGAVEGFSNPADPCRPGSLVMPFIDHDNDPDTPEQRVYDPSLELREDTVIENCQNGGGPFGLEPTNPFALGVRGLDGPNPSFLGAPTLVASGSNPALGPETSEAETVGIVFEQPWSDRFDLSLSATWFEIVIDDEVDSLSANTIVNRCYNSPGLVDPTCAFITRDPRDESDSTSGEVSFVSALNQNLGQQIAEGIDYNLDFNMDFSAVNWNMIVRATQSKTQTEEEFRATEIFLNDNLTEFGNPEWRVNLTNIVEWRDWSFLWQYRYIDEQIEDVDDIEDQDDTSSGFDPCVQAGDTFTGHPAIEDGRCVSFDDIDSYKVHDVSVAWRGENTVVRFGVANVFDDAPPITNNNSLFNNDANGSGIGGVGYDLRGRTFFLNVTMGL
jgi:iron complex outermembrane receptor protein